MQPNIDMFPNQTAPTIHIYGTFFLGGDEFAIEMADLQEVVNAPHALQRMPLAPKYLLGLFHLRGSVLPVVDLRILLNADVGDPHRTGTQRMAVLRRDVARLGLLFDAVGEILRLRSDDVVPVEHHNLSAECRAVPIKAVICRDNGQRVIQVLDLGRLLAVKNLPLIQSMTETREGNHVLTSRMKDLYREKLIGFSVGECQLALEMKCIVAIIQNADKKASPCRSELCASVIQFHSRLVPVIEIAHLLSISSLNASKHILVCAIGDSQIGFEVDEICSIIPYARDKILPVPVLEEHRASVFHGSFTDREGKDFIVLNEEGMLSNAEVIAVSNDHRRLLQQTKNSVDNRTATQHVSLLTFRMGKLYGIRLLDVVEVMVCPHDLASAPNMPPAVLGILNLRGSPISVVDPRRLFDVEPVHEGIDHKLLIFQHRGRRIAIRVDSVESIISVSVDVDAALPGIFFNDDQRRLKDTFERGVQVVANDEKKVVLILGSDQIANRLAEALTA